MEHSAPAISKAIDAACKAVNAACEEVNAALTASPRDPERLAQAAEKLKVAKTELDQLTGY